MRFRNIVLVAGARPNFMKIAPIIEAIFRKQLEGVELFYSLVHTGQHWDYKMSEAFFSELEIPKPQKNLEAGGGSQAEQTAAIMIRFEEFLLQNPCDLVVVVGDVTSTLACAIVAKKLNIRVAHVEAGIRSGDISMPEEVNRLVTDSITDLFFTTSAWASDNLRKEGKNDAQIFFVGNTMIDTLLKNMSRLRQPLLWDSLLLQSGKYFLMTLHRPANVDSKERLQKILKAIEETTCGLPVIFSVHPRTKKNMEGFKMESPAFHLVEPMSYLEFNYLVKNAKGVITDSGGITEETTVMGIPCITLRESTERPETCTIGTNELVGTNPEELKSALHKIMSGEWKKGGIPELWDGNAASRIIEIIEKL